MRAGKRRRLIEVLTETTTGEMYRAAIPRVFAALLREQAELSIEFNGRELTDLVLHLFRRGFAVGINRAGGTGPPRCFGIVIRDGAKGEIRRVIGWRPSSTGYKGM